MRAVTVGLGIFRLDFTSHVEVLTLATYRGAFTFQSIRECGAMTQISLLLTKKKPNPPPEGQQHICMWPSRLSQSSAY